ncbi:hypothetical protein KC866_01515 [Patescibacteria group bacterium]|nr:hypothetical protein [Patescibacteria group bacterium]
MDFVGSIAEFFQGDFSGPLAFFRFLGFLISLALLGGCIYAWINDLNVSLRKRDRREEHFNVHEQLISSPQRERWDSIRGMFSSSNPTDWRMAIIDADSMLEDLVTQMGHQGDSFGEKLMSLRDDGVSWTDAAWDVHLLRNKLAHEGSGYPLSDREAFRAYKIYENILSESGYLA